MADHTPPLESGQLLSPELPVLASPPPPAMVNGEGPQQVCLSVSHTHSFIDLKKKEVFSSSHLFGLALFG